MFKTIQKTSRFFEFCIIHYHAWYYYSSFDWSHYECFKNLGKEQMFKNENLISNHIAQKDQVQKDNSPDRWILRIHLSISILQGIEQNLGGTQKNAHGCCS